MERYGSSLTREMKEFSGFVASIGMALDSRMKAEVLKIMSTDSFAASSSRQGSYMHSSHLSSRPFPCNPSRSAYPINTKISIPFTVQ